MLEDYGNSVKTLHIQQNFYDAENMRYGMEEDNVRTNFITNDWSVFTELDAEWKPTKRLVRGYGIVASEEVLDNGGFHYYIQNEHGDVEYITGSAGKIENAYTYDVFGNITNSTELVQNRYTYNGEQYDPVTQQYYLRARYYNPLVGRFTQEDVYRGDGLNLYVYCGNNPVVYVDPSGDERASGKQRADYATGDTPQLVNDAVNGVNVGDKNYGLCILNGANSNDASAIAILNENGLDGIWYKDQRPDFTPVSMFNVEIENMSSNRQVAGGNYD